MQRAQARKAESERRRALRRAGRAVAGVGAALGTAALLAPGAHAATFQVTSLADAGPGSLRDALAAANLDDADDTILFDSSVTGSINLQSELRVEGPVNIAGPGAGRLSIDGHDAVRLFHVNTGLIGSVGDTAKFSGLTFTGGKASGLGTLGDGGAILAAQQSRVEVVDSVFTGNHAEHYGGAINIDRGGATLSGSTFTGNSAGSYGGAICADGITAPFTVTNSTVSDNDALYGGGVALYDPRGHGDVTISRTTLARNHAINDGGGIWVDDTFELASVTVRESTVSDNTALAGGGGISFSETSGGASEIVNSTIVGNTAAFGGGVLFADVAVPDPDYPELTDDGSFALRSSTVSGNHATTAGGGIWRGYPMSDSTGRGAVSDLTVVSSVIAGNDAATSAPDAGTSKGVTGVFTLNHTLLQSTAGATFTAPAGARNITGVSPLLNPLARTGGPTATMTPATGSPLIDAGLPGTSTTDQRGRTRTYDVPGVTNVAPAAGTDIGAVELSPNIPPVVTAPSKLPVVEDTLTTITGVSVVDPDDSGDEGRALLSVSPGTGVLVADAAGVTGSGGETLTFRGTTAALRALLDSGAVKFMPAKDRDMDSTLTITFTDANGSEVGGFDTASAQVFLDLLPVEDPPVIAAKTITPIPDGTPTVCNDLRIALRPVATKGGVALVGVTLSRFAGLEAALFAGSARVGTAVVQANGTFAATVPRPKKGVSTSYHAVVKDATSLSYKLATGLAAFTVNGKKLSGRITGPKATRPKQVALYVQNSCAKRTKVGLLTVAPDGTVKTTIKTPKAGFAVYRISTQLKGTAKGFLAPSAFALR